MSTPTEALSGRDLRKAKRKIGWIFGAATAALLMVGQLAASPGPTQAASTSPGKREQEAINTKPLKPPTQGSIPVAFLISQGAQIIDFAGPWEVFQDVSLPGRADAAFRLYTVSQSAAPIEASGGMKIIPDYTLANAPAPKVIVIPAQSKPSAAVLDWIRKASKDADVTMSVCTGAFVLAQTGLLSGKDATTFHGAFKRFAVEFPDVHLKRGARFVDDGNLATAGGLSSGIDLALHVVERYYGRAAAEETAYTMEYQGQGWMNPNSNQLYAKARVSPGDTRSVQFAEWRSTRKPRLSPSTKARPIISAPLTTRQPSRRLLKNLRRPIASKGRRSADGIPERPLAAAGADVFLKFRVAKKANHGAIEGVVKSLLIVIGSS